MHLEVTQTSEHYFVSFSVFMFLQIIIDLKLLLITLFIASHKLLAANHTLPCEVEITALRRKHLGN